MSMAPSYQNILVGGSGFIGSALALALVEKGESVLSISRHEGEKIPGVSELFLDIADSKTLAKAFPQGEVVFILIGQNNPQFNVEEELATLENLVTVLNKRRPKKVLYLSSVLVYGETEVPATETDPCHPADQYSEFKCRAEELLKKQLDPNISLGVVRLANVYGGKKNRGFIGLVMNSLLQKEEKLFRINGDGLQERDYIFIDDVISALLLISARLTHSDTVNIATGKSHTLLDIITSVMQITGKDFPYEKTGQELKEVKKSRINNERLQKVYHFSPVYSLLSGIKKTIQRSGASQMKVSGKRILFLGGEGFIGRNLASFFSSENTCFSAGKHKSIFADRKDTFLQNDPYRESIPGSYDVIVHLIDNKVSLDTFEEEERKLLNNLSVTENSHVILFSSAVIYANPDSEYGKRKKLLENFYNAYCSKQNIPLTIFRPFNIFGSFQMPYRQGSLIANLTYNLLSERSTEINDMDARRDFMYAHDLGKFVAYAVTEKKTGTFDIGSGVLTRIKDLITHLGQTVAPQELHIINRNHKENIIEKPATRTLMVSTPMVSFEEGLKHTVQFYRNNLSLLKDYVERNIH